jgi:TrmH family RNA methyltransferase
MIPLHAISILLLEPQSAGNIGSVARVMKNFSLGSLYLINPQTEITEESLRLACGADDILKTAQRTETLPEALRSFNLCVGTTSRCIFRFPEVLNPNQLAMRLADFPAGESIALLFGPERTGLTNEHIQYCQWLVTIPSSPDFESINLSHAVAVLAYELYSHQWEPALGRELQRAPLDQVEFFFETLKENLREIGFLKESDPDRMMATIRNIFSRASLEDRDVRILRGILRQWDWYAKEIKKKG